MLPILLFVSLSPLVQDVTVTAPAREKPPRDLSETLAEEFDGSDLPAIGAALFDMEGVLALGVTGVRSSASEEPVTLDDPWHLGSCTKAMTATLAARLVEQDVIAWTTTVGEVFGDGLEEMDEAWNGVSLHLLLGNRGGAPSKLDAGGLWLRLRRHEGTPLEQRRELVESVLSRPPVQSPGTEFLYSNAGFALAGAMLEARAGLAWEELMRREVFEPLGMQGAGFGAPGETGEEQPSAPRGHRRRGEAWSSVPPGRLADNPAAIGPAGTVHAPLADWASFLSAHLRGAAGDESYLSWGSWQRLQTPLDGQGYACGWLVSERPWAGGTALNHAGSNTLWFCVTWLAPGRGFGVLVTTNAAGPEAERAASDVTNRLLTEHLQAIDPRRER